MRIAESNDPYRSGLIQPDFLTVLDYITLHSWPLCFSRGIVCRLLVGRWLLASLVNAPRLKARLICHIYYQ